MDDRTFDILLDIHHGLPRQGPGDDVFTRRALAMCDGLPATPDVLDVGCGPGMQTLALADALGSEVTAVDIFDLFLNELRDRAQARGLDAMVHPVKASMDAMPFADASFDLIWAEGSAYVMGVGEAVQAWRPLLRDGGCIAFTEMVWLVDEPPAEAASFFGQEYPAMTDVPTNLQLIRDAGYEVVGHFTLPDSAWWDNYYAPLEARLPEMRRKYADDPQGLDMIAASQREIDVRRQFPDAYGYEFFVAKSTDMT